jgi:predicted TIM-barrel fold metal-dependent hydrolase
VGLVQVSPSHAPSPSRSGVVHAEHLAEEIDVPADAADAHGDRLDVRLLRMGFRLVSHGVSSIFICRSAAFRVFRRLPACSRICPRVSVDNRASPCRPCPRAATVNRFKPLETDAMSGPVTLASLPLAQPRIDCHVHVFDPASFPYPDDVAYRPAGHEIATTDALGHLMASHGVRHAMIVGPNSGYSLDNRCLLDALRRGAGRFKGAAVVRNDTGRDELQALQAQGVTFNAALLGTDFYRDAAPLLQRLRDLGLWAAVQVQHDQLVDLRPMLTDSGVPIVFDHCGRPDPGAGVGQAGFQALLEMAGTGRAAVKLSSMVKTSLQPFPHEDGWVYVRALLDAYTPQALVWGSDWPFLRAPARVDYGPLLDLFGHLVPDPAARQAILWDTPKRLFGF